MKLAKPHHSWCHCLVHCNSWLHAAATALPDAVAQQQLLQCFHNCFSWHCRLLHGNSCHHTPLSSILYHRSAKATCLCCPLPLIDCLSKMKFCDAIACCTATGTAMLLRLTLHLCTWCHCLLIVCCCPWLIVDISEYFDTMVPPLHCISALVPHACLHHRLIVVIHIILNFSWCYQFLTAPQDLLVPWYCCTWQCACDPWLLLLVSHCYQLIVSHLSCMLMPHATHQLIVNGQLKFFHIKVVSIVAAVANIDCLMRSPIARNTAAKSCHYLQ